MRTCVGCRQRADWSRLLRVVAARVGNQANPEDGGVPGTCLEIVPDPRHRLPGRGAWLHPDLGCLDLALRRRALPRALRLQQSGVDTRRLREYVTRQADSTTG